MATSTKHKKSRQQYSLPEAGSSPGLIYIDEKAQETKIKLHTISKDTYTVVDLPDLHEVKKIIVDKYMTFWIEIQGLKSATMFKFLLNDLHVNKLILEDITRTYQRPKYEQYDDYDFAISRMLLYDEDKCLVNEQFAFLLTDNTLFTFQEKHQNCMEPVRRRLKAGKGNIRTAGSSYIMYAMMDTIVDTYFKILGAFGDELDKIEDRLLEKVDKSIMFDTQSIKRNLMNVKRVSWPERDKLNDMIRSDSPFITDQTKLFLRDAYDHIIQIIDINESLKEIATSNIDTYLSVISNRMNEIMKVLTIISSIFIPLTFIAGIYGMNFAKQDPVTGKLLPANMPELYQEHGYLYTMIIMFVIAILQVVYFWRRGWFK
ncbi:MAG: magnesium and cobalt transport protein CorA [Pedobacter sp.]|jgi:magnesium transporter|nr:magnesium and cobalt transport protein CorA [Pedobacter sp.]